MTQNYANCFFEREQRAPTSIGKRIYPHGDDARIMKPADDR